MTDSNSNAVEGAQAFEIEVSNFVAPADNEMSVPATRSGNALYARLSTPAGAPSGE